ncbi:MAG TPA: DNA-binding protein [Sedimenticola sp.]|nr:DNA-binding protein [Sedimenticola sp.]
MTEALLWNLDEAARQLGNVSTRTVRRMLERGDLPTVRIGRSVRVPADAVKSWVDKNMTIPHNPTCAGQDVQGGKSTCHTGARIVPFGGSVTPTQAGRELDALLERRTERKRKR